MNRSGKRNQIIAPKIKNGIYSLFVTLFLFSLTTGPAFSQTARPKLSYTISIPQPESQCYDLELQISGWEQDTVRLKLPNWMPGYYQMMDYAKDLENIAARDENGISIAIEKLHENTWCIKGVRDKRIIVSYTIRTRRQFVANSYVDKDHAYLVPGNSFLYVDGFIQIPVSIKINVYPEWEHIATGLEPVQGKTGEYAATDFDMLYDCPVLIGNLEELPPFEVKGTEHRFIGYKLGSFNRDLFMDNLKRVVQAAADIIGEIPYERYTFIAVGPGRGGIEHSNNTTVSFDGSRLDSPEGMDRMMQFLAHEYFHHYNVKRIRPFELGPFDYDRGNRTNLLWISEGLTVYYEAQIMKRAGLIDPEIFLSYFNTELNTLENDSGRFFQTLSQASYYTWEEGPFGGGGPGPDRSISVYNKGAVVGMLLDLEIRGATGNKKSLDDVMRKLYYNYYKEEDRGFTDAEFQQVCEEVAGTSLKDLFEYVYTTKEIDYSRYLSRAGLGLETMHLHPDTEAQRLIIIRLAEPSPLQAEIRNSWLGE